MIITSKEANKLITKLEIELQQVLDHENRVSKFVAATCEKLEDARPKYDLLSTKKEKEDIQKKIRTIKHALNVFNTTTLVDGFNITVDEMLVYILQLQNNLIKLENLANEEEKKRLAAKYNIIEYAYANYDINEAKKYMNEVRQEIIDVQQALDKVNLTKTFEINI